MKGVGPKRAERMAGLGIVTVADLLRHLPLRYEDLSRRVPVAQLRDGDTGTVAGRVVDIETGGGGRRPRFVCGIDDGTGTLRAVWFGRTRARRVCEPGAAVVVAGTARRWQGELQMVNPTLETADEAASATSDTGRIRPVYPTTEGVPAMVVRRLVASALSVIAFLIVIVIVAIYVKLVKPMKEL